MKFKFANKNLIIFEGLFLISGFLWLTPNALTYSDTTTHPDLTREIITFYELSTGKKFTDEQKNWVISGSIEEDKSPRWLNHFYDPVFERGLQAESVGISGYLAKNWAQFSSYQTISPSNIGNLWSGKGPVISGSWWGDFSYEAAIKDYSKNKEKESYVALGHILHLIEDMTVPEHTRNDLHPGGSENLISFYENWTKDNSNGLTQDLGKKIYNQGRKPIIYSELESYFNNLAIYTNTHFFSPRTIKSDIYQKPKIVFEDGTFAYGEDKDGMLFDLAIIETYSPITKKYTYNLKDTQVLQEYWLRLSRQAVVNGAGVIQLFLSQAEKARQEEIVKEKQSKLKSSFLSQILNFFKSPDTPTGEPVLTITSEPTASALKIAKQETAANLAVVEKPVLAQPKPVPSIVVPNPIPAPIPVPAPAPTPAPQNTAPGFSGGGGGGGGSGSSSAPAQQTNQLTNEQETQQTNSNATSTDNNLNILTFGAGDLVINEIMYDLEGSDTTSNKSREWVEIYNNSGRNIILTGGTNGWRFNDGSNHILNEPPTNGSQGLMTIPVSGYFVLTGDAATFLSDYFGFSGTVIDTVMSLKNSTSTIKISAPDSIIIDEVTYSNSWGANGNGKTLERKSAGGSSNDVTNWAQSSAPGGTPGAANNFEVVAATSSLPVATSTPSIATSTEPILTSLGTDVAATTTITTNTAWTLAGNPYRLFFDGQRRPTVAAGATLTIDPGVKIIPQSGGATALEIKGTLNAIATQEAPIIFTSITDADNNASTTPQKGDWLNIVFSTGSLANLDYVEFRYGGQGNTLPLSEIVNIIGSTVNIKNSKFENSQNTALHLIDSSGIIENSIFSDNNCGISVDSFSGIATNSYGGCYGLHTTGQAVSSTTLKINNNQFIRNQNIGIEVRSGTAPIINNNIFTDNSYPVKIESSYPVINNSQIINSTTSPNILNGIAISGYTHFSRDFTLKKDLPYILETNGPALSPYVDLGAILTIDPGVIFKIGHTFTAFNIYGSLIASTTLDNPIVFTSLKDDSRGGDTNNDTSISSPQDNDWASIKFLTGSIGNFYNTLFNFGGFGSPPAATTTSSKLIADFPLVANVSNQSCDAITSKININSNENFSKVIIHKLTNNNPIDNVKFLLGESTTEFGNYSTHEEVIINNPSYNNSEIELNFNSAINVGLWYVVRILGINNGSIANNCDWGTDAMGNLASEWHKLVTTVSNPAISIDPGAIVVIQ